MCTEATQLQYAGTTSVNALQDHNRCSESHSMSCRPDATQAILLDKDADEAHDNINNKQPCLVAPDAWGQRQRLHQSPAHLHMHVLLSGKSKAGASVCSRLDTPQRFTCNLLGIPGSHQTVWTSPSKLTVSALDWRSPGMPAQAKRGDASGASNMRALACIALGQHLLQVSQKP